MKLKFGFKKNCFKCFNLKCMKFSLQSMAILTLCLILIIPMSLLVHFKYFVGCSDIKGRNQISEMCRLYHAGEIVGGVCSTLCDENMAQYAKCAGNHYNKMVEILYCNECVKEVTPDLQNKITSKVVLKSEVDMNRWDPFVQTQFPDTESREDKENKLVSNIVSQIKRDFKVDLPRDQNILRSFIGDNYTNVIKSLNKSNSDIIVYRNVALLSGQIEFLAMIAFAGLSFIPKLYGTCGPAYLVEYTPPISIFNYVALPGKISEVVKLEQWQSSWTERASMALRFLNFIREIEHVFERPLHVCDASSANFGVNSAGRVVLPDLGGVIFERNNPRSCGSDSDCDYYSCRGVCDINGTHVCKLEVQATNLQIICKEIFHSRVEQFGLLRNPPTKVAEQLRDLLQRCAFTSPRLIRLPKDNYSDKDMMMEFEEILKASLDMQSS